MNISDASVFRVTSSSALGNFMPLFSTATSPPTAIAGAAASCAVLAPDSAATLLWSTCRRPRSVPTG